MKTPQTQKIDGGIGGFLRRLTSNSLFSYITIFLLQLKIMWGVWYLRDMTTGDTTYYFLNAHSWVTKGQAPILKARLGATIGPRDANAAPSNTELP